MAKVSIVIPTYERPECLDRLLNSIAQQTYQDYEVIVIDDCSSGIEAYQRVIRKYQTLIKKLDYIRNNSNFGSPVKARNEGLKLASGEYVAFCDDDDEWYPDKLQMQMDKFERSNSKLGLVYTWADTIMETTGEIVYQYRGELEGNITKELLKRDFIPTSSVMVRKSEIQAVGGMDEDMVFCCEDWDTWIRMLKSGTLCGVVRKVLLKYYRREGECFSMSPGMYRGYLQFYRRHFFYALRISPTAAYGYLKHLLSILVKQRMKK